MSSKPGQDQYARGIKDRIFAYIIYPFLMPNHNSSPTTQVFISYARKDITQVQKIVDILNQRGIETWMDKGLRSGEVVQDEIYQAIEKSSVFLYFISPFSVRSKWCDKEIEYATDCGKKFVPIMISDVPFEAIPIKVSKYEWIDCIEGKDDLDAAVENMYSDILDDYDWQEYHTELLEKALKWEKAGQNRGLLLRDMELTRAEQELQAIDPGKDPQPVELQHTYVLASRKEENARHKRLMTIAAATLTVISVSILFALLFYIQQQQSSQQAITKEIERATAQANADQQGNFALARKLAQQGQLIFDTPDADPMLGLLLTLESLNLYPTQEAIQILYSQQIARQVTRVYQQDVRSNVAFSPAGNVFASGNLSGQVQLWNTQNGVEHLKLEYEDMFVITSLDFSPNGKFLLTGDGSNHAIIWDLKSGDPIHIMPHDDYLERVLFDPAGKTVITSSADNTLRVWDTDSGEEISRFTYGEEMRVQAISSDGRFAAFKDRDATRLILWNIPAKQEVAVIEHEYQIDSVAFSANGEIMFSVSNGDVADAWQTSDGQHLSVFESNAFISSFAISPDGKRASIGTIDGVLTILDITSGSPISTKMQGGSISYLAYSPNGIYILSGNTNGMGFVFDAQTGNEIASLFHGAPIESGDFSADEKQLLLLGKDGFITVWDVASLFEASQTVHEYPISSLDISSDSQYIASGGADFYIHVWRADDPAQLTWLTDDRGVSALAFSPDGKYLASGDNAGNLLLWNHLTGTKLSLPKHEKRVTSIAFSPDGNYLASSSGGILRILSVENWQEVFLQRYSDEVKDIQFSIDSKRLFFSSGDTLSVLQRATWQEVFQAYSKNLRFVSMSPDGKSVASSTYEGILRFWSIETKRDFSFQYNGDITSIAFNPSSDRLLVGGVDHVVRLIDISSGQEEMQFLHDDDVETVAFSADGKYAASGGDDASVRVWDLQTGLEIVRFFHNQRVRQVQFSPDGKYVISFGADQIVHVWLYRSADIVSLMCSLVTRNITETEWAQYIGDKLAYQAVCTNLPLAP